MAVAEKLERWRYQSLNERFGELPPKDAALLDSLDLAANDLAGRPIRAPRAALAAIRTSAPNEGAIDDALEALDAKTPLEWLVREATDLTNQHFRTDGPQASSGKGRRRVLMYAPLYLSSDCVNYCLYCGFRYPLQILRKTLSCEEALREAEVLRQRGFRHVLLVAGDYPSRMTTPYFLDVVRALSQRGVRPSIEIAPQTTHAYAQMIEAGVCGLTLYQETYDERRYAQYHIRGPKTSYAWRLEAMDRAAEAGMPRLGLGILLGLHEPREELRALMRHAQYLQQRFADRTLAFSLPRIHDAPQDFRVPYAVDDETFVRLYCALRLAFPQAELVLSTREPVALRNRLAQICITQLSAGSCTAPGGYSVPADACGQQFHISDQRSAEEVVQWLESAGLLPVWDVPARL